jgi:hypothetical protein
MASGGKRKTTMAKLMRESKLRERRQDKQARKDARKLAADNGEDPSGGPMSPLSVDSGQPDAGLPAAEPVAES